MTPLQQFNQEEEKRIVNDFKKTYVKNGFLLLNTSDLPYISNFLTLAIQDHDARRDEFMEANLENSAWAKAYRLMCHEELRKMIVENGKFICDCGVYNDGECPRINKILSLFHENNNK